MDPSHKAAEHTSLLCFYSVRYQCRQLSPVGGRRSHFDDCWVTTECQQTSLWTGWEETSQEGGNNTHNKETGEGGEGLSMGLLACLPFPSGSPIPPQVTIIYSLTGK